MRNPAARSTSGWITVAVACAAACLLLAPLLRGVPRSHDLHIHLAMLDQFRHGLAEGSLYPRWLPEFNDGLGAPTMIFYPPGLFYAASLGAWVAGGDSLAGLYLAMGALAAVGFAGIHRLLAGPVGAWAAAGVALALVVPFRAFELHAAGLFPAFAAGCVFPWALVNLDRIAAALPAGGLWSRSVTGWALAVAAMTVLNLPFTALAGLLVAGWLGLETLATRRLMTAMRVTAGAAMGAALAAVYLLPALVEQDRVVLPQAGRAVYAGNFLFMPPGSWSDPALQDLFQRMTMFPLLLAGLGVAILVLAARDPKHPLSDSGPGLVRLLAATAVGALFLATPLSRWIWAGVPALATLQLPWRLLDHLSVPLALFPALALAAVWRSPDRSQGIRIAVAGFTGLMAVLMGFLSLSCAEMNGFAPARQIAGQIPSWRQMTGDYLPRGADPSRASAAARPVAVIGGTAHGTVTAWGPEHRRIEIAADTPCEILVRTWYYAGWVARDGHGVPLPVAPQTGSGQIMIRVPPGRHIVNLEFSATPMRALAAWISGVATLGLVGLGAWRRPSRRRLTPDPATGLH
jgi:hypothetical protein